MGLNFDPRQFSMDAYVLARQTKSVSESLQAMKIYALSNFFTFAENLSHDEKLNAIEVRRLLKKKIFEFANVLDLTEEECEMFRMSKSEETSLHRRSGNVINLYFTNIR